MEEDILTIKLTKGQVAIVDAEDFEYLNSFKWCVVTSGTSKGFSVRRRIGNKLVPMANMIMERHFGLKEGVIYDHINLNGLDNRKDNLRPSTYSQNGANVPKKKKNPTSKYKGVFFERSCNRWRAKIRKDYKNIHIGVFKTENEAARAYNEKAKQLFGEFAYLNIIDE